MADRTCGGTVGADSSRLRPKCAYSRARGRRQARGGSLTDQELDDVVAFIRRWESAD